MAESKYNDNRPRQRPLILCTNINQDRDANVTRQYQSVISIYLLLFRGNESSWWTPFSQMLSLAYKYSVFSWHDLLNISDNDTKSIKSCISSHVTFWGKNQNSATIYNISKIPRINNIQQWICIQKYTYLCMCLLKVLISYSIGHPSSSDSWHILIYTRFIF